MTADIKEIIYTVLASGAFFTFVQFIITRHDNKKNVRGEIEKQMNDGFKEVKTEINDVKTNVKAVSEGLAEHKATLARTHILRFADELRHGSHSKEYFEQQLLDIKTYNDYCEAHPKYKNNMTEWSSEFIENEYKRQFLTVKKDDTA